MLLVSSIITKEKNVRFLTNCEGEWMIRRIGLEIRNTSTVIKRELDQLTRGILFDGPSGMHGLILHYLFDHIKEDVFQKDLENYLGVRRSTVSEMLFLIEKKGYIVRENAFEDGRVKKIKITDLGITIHKKIHTKIDDFELKLAHSLSEEEVNTLFRILNQIRMNLKGEENND